MRKALVVVFFLLLTGGTVVGLRNLRGNAPAPTPTPAILPTSTPAVSVSFTDHADGWDWDADCAPQAQAWLSSQAWAKGIRSVTVVLVDEKAEKPVRKGPEGHERDLSRGVAWPDGLHMKALSLADCVGSADVTCYVAPVQGTDMDAVSLTASAAWASALRDGFHHTTKREWEKGEWKWSDFEPLVRKDGGKWESACLRLRPSH